MSETCRGGCGQGRVPSLEMPQCGEGREPRGRRSQVGRRKPGSLCVPETKARKRLKMKASQGSVVTTAADDSSGRTDAKDGPLDVVKRGLSVTLPGVLSAQPG